MEETKVKNDEKQSKQKNKMKIWKKILIIIVIILTIFLIDTIRKFIIIRKVVNQYDQDSKSTNYYAKTIGESHGVSTEIWRLENKKLFKNTSYGQKGLVERMIYTDDDKKEQWIIVNQSEEKVAVQLEYNKENLLIGPVSGRGITNKQ